LSPNPKQQIISHFRYPCEGDMESEIPYIQWLSGKK